MGWLSEDELRGLGFRSLGTGVRISSEARIYRPHRISIGDHSRIDDFATLTASEEGFIGIGSYVHIGAYSMVEAPLSVTFDDFSGLSARVSVYGSSDDYVGPYMTNPCVPMEMRNVNTSPVHFGKHVVVGASSVILPGSQLGEGCSVGALSLVRGKLEPFGVYSGTPARRRGERSRGMLALEAEFKERAST